jgi:hypothetical protein
MAGPEEAEVAVIQSGQLGFVETFYDGKYCSVHEPYVGVPVTVTDLTNALVILGLQFLDAKGASDNVVQEGRQYALMQADMDPVVHLHQDRRRYNERFVRCLYELAARGVVGIAPVEGGVEWPCVQDQRHERDSASSGGVGVP